MRAGVDDAIGGEMFDVGVAVLPAELEDDHALKAQAVSHFANFGGEDAQVFGDEALCGIFTEQHFKELFARCGEPAACFGACGHLWLAGGGIWGAVYAPMVYIADEVIEP